MFVSFKLKMLSTSDLYFVTYFINYPLGSEKFFCLGRLESFSFVKGE